MLANVANSLLPPPPLTPFHSRSSTLSTLSYMLSSPTLPSASKARLYDFFTYPFGAVTVGTTPGSEIGGGIYLGCFLGAGEEARRRGGGAKATGPKVEVNEWEKVRLEEERRQRAQRGWSEAGAKANRSLTYLTPST